ncbi:MAG TPA: efflux RND transporter periplasmic adaptor subunit [candidate division Zixibacteria bacterium]|nr:efflux RND transporter periplasmic adaptor subunit [candidate division Zixibacteria bacterium]
MTRAAKIVFPVVILVAGIGLMFLFLSFRGTESKRTPPPRTRTVEVEEVVLEDIVSQIEVYGRIVSAQPIDLVSEVAGVLVDGDHNFRPGALFRRGEMMIKVDDRQATYSLNATESQLLNALASVLPEIKIDFPDQYKVWQGYFEACNFDEPLPSMPEAANAKMKLYLSRYNVYQLYFQALEQEVTLEKHHFVAPFDASVVSASLRAGSAARAGSVIGSIVNLEAMEVEFPVSINDVPWLKIGAVVTLHSRELDKDFNGRVVRIGQSIDKNTQTIKAYVRLENAGDAIIDGTFVEGQIPGQELASAIAVPRSAIYDDHYVYLIRDGALQLQSIEIARKETEIALVNGGLKNGDSLVIQMLQGVAPGDPARPRQNIGQEGI